MEKSAIKRFVRMTAMLPLLGFALVSSASEQPDRGVTASWQKQAPAAKAPANLKGESKLVVPAAKKPAAKAGEPTMRLYMPVIGGDSDIVAPMPLWKDFKDFVTFNPVTRSFIASFKAQLTKELQEKGYVFANIQIPEKMWESGILMVIVDCGPLGNITVKGAKHYSSKQIVRALQNQEGKFNYNTVYGDLFDLNAQADLKVDTRFRPTIRNGRRVVDAELEVEDSLPVHGSIELANTGTKESNELRIRTTLQHYNLTQHDDTLTLDWLTGGDMGETLNSFNASYHLPLGEDWTIGGYVGYNQSEYDNVMPEIDINGKGHYYGLQISKILHEDMYSRWQLTAGWNFSKLENRLGLDDEDLNRQAVAVSTPFATLGYSSKVFDRFHGRNFASVTVMRNFAGKYGASEKDVYVTDDHPNCDGDFFMGKIQLARYQKLHTSDQDTPGKWTLFAKADLQLSDSTLPSSVRSYVGGFNSVRGYAESELGGDNAFTGTLEFRTPLLHNFIPGLKQSEDFLQENPKYWGMHKLQLVVFSDFGYVSNEDPLEDDLDNQTMISLGAGLRLALTRYAQFSLDYGYPLIEASDDTPNDGRFHLSLQLQF